MAFPEELAQLKETIVKAKQRKLDFDADPEVRVAVGKSLQKSFDAVTDRDVEDAMKISESLEVRHAVELLIDKMSFGKTYRELKELLNSDSLEPSASVDSKNHEQVISLYLSLFQDETYLRFISALRGLGIFNF